MGAIIPLFIPHRGCPHQCSFCNQESITGCSEASLSEYVNDFVDEIEKWLSRFKDTGSVEVAFYGGSFTCLPEQEQHLLLSVVQPYIQSGRVSSIRLSTRPDCLSEGIIAFLKDYGVKKVELGVQSLDDRVLQKSKRGHKAEDSINSILLLRKAGVEVGVQLMVGLPGENTTSFLTGVNLLGKIKPDFVRLYPVVVVKNSELEKQYQADSYKPLTMNKAIALATLFQLRMQQFNIPVIRIGLQPSRELESQLVTGPFHPSFGELVKSRIWLKRIRKYFNRVPDGVPVTLNISDRDFSSVVGLKKMNIDRLRQLGLEERLLIKTDKNIERGNFEFTVSNSSEVQVWKHEN